MTHVCAPLCALAALIGHSKSIFLGFQGGKSAATGLGTVIALNNAVGALLFATWLLVLGRDENCFGRIHRCSLAPAGLFLCAGCPPAQVAYGVMALIYVTLRHKANIKRLMEGTEPKSRSESERCGGSALTAKLPHQRLPHFKRGFRHQRTKTKRRINCSHQKNLTN